MKKRQVTIIDVAREAGVSIATVSNVLNKRNVPISQDTIQKVEEAALGLCYRRNVVAANLSRRRTNELGLIIPGFGGYFGRFAERMERAVHKYGYHLSVYSTNYNPDMERHHMDALLQRRVDGLFCHGLAMKPDGIRQVVSDETPMVLFNAWDWPQDIAIGAVNLGFADGSAEAVRHLYERGCRRFVYLSRPSSMQTNQQRVTGYQKGILSLPETVDSKMIEIDMSMKNKWIERVIEAAVGGTSPSGILAFDDKVGFLCLTELQKRGIRIPEQVKLVGINNEFISKTCNPAMTTLDIDYNVQAETAVRWMMTELGELNTPIEGPEFTVTMALVKRRSTE